MYTCLSTITTLHPGFRSPQPPPDLDSRRSPPLRRLSHPFLHSLFFPGLLVDNLVAHIGAPLLDDLSRKLFISRIRRTTTPATYRWLGLAVLDFDVSFSPSLPSLHCGTTRRLQVSSP